MIDAIENRHVNRPVRRRPILRPALRLITVLAVAAFGLSQTSSALESDAPATKYMLIVTGGELLNGIYPDGHTYFITRTLRPLGLQCVGSMSVDDRRSDMLDALEFARGRAELIIVTGGLGPTDSDITRNVLSEFTKISLREDPGVLSAMSRRFGVKPENLRDNLRRQCLTPTGGSWLANSNGTAVGLVFELHESVIVALPGPPGELQPMVTDRLVPYLHKRFASHLPGCSLTVRFVGVGQSGLDQQLKQRVRIDDDILITSQFSGGRVDFTFTMPADTPANRMRLEKLKSEIAEKMGSNIYGYDDETLEESVMNLLRKNSSTLVLVEAASGGALTAALSGSSSIGDVLAGAYVAPSRQRLAAMLNSDDSSMQELAAAAASSVAGRWALVVGQTTNDNSSRPSVEVVIRSPEGHTRTLTMQTRGSGEMALQRLSTQLLAALRGQLIQADRR